MVANTDFTSPGIISTAFSTGYQQLVWMDWKTVCFSLGFTLSYLAGQIFLSSCSIFRLLVWRNISSGSRFNITASWTTV